MSSAHFVNVHFLHLFNYILLQNVILRKLLVENPNCMSFYVANVICETHKECHITKGDFPYNLVRMLIPFELGAPSCDILATPIRNHF